MNFTTDPEFKELIPPLQPEEYKQLEDSLTKDGNLQPVVVWEEKGILIDGHHRYEICQRLNIQLKEPLKLSFTNRARVLIWIIRNQLARRNLVSYQRIELAFKLEMIIAEQARENLSLGGGDRKSDEYKSGLSMLTNPMEPIDTREQVADIANVSVGTVHKAKH